MRKHTAFAITKKKARPTLSEDDVKYWKKMLSSTLKVGYEFELNLPEPEGLCAGNELLCPCAFPFNVGNKKCYQMCTAWATCSIKKKHGCVAEFCLEFQTPCYMCPKYEKDCNKCPLYNDPKNKPNERRNRLSKTLLPSKTVGTVGQFGVLKVIKDGSLEGDGGVEIPTVGRRISFKSFYIQAKKILDECKDEGAFMNERSSLHIHLLAGYYCDREGRHIDELEKPVPEIILANYHQLMKRYQNALAWMGSAGKEKNKLTRWIKFRLPISRFSALEKTMEKVKAEMASVSGGHTGKYFFVTYYNTLFDSDTPNIKRLHIEARFCDGIESPSVIAAHGVLQYALMMKAVELSRYGIVHPGDEEWRSLAKIIEEKILNNAGSWDGPRHGDTSELGTYIEDLRKQSKELVRVLRPILRLYGDTLHILEAIAEKPCSLRRCEGKSWNEIEEEVRNKNIAKHRKLTSNVLQVIDMCEVDDCDNIEEWTEAVCENLRFRPELVVEVINSLISSHVIAWNTADGCIMRC